VNSPSVGDVDLLGQRHAFAPVHLPFFLIVFLPPLKVEDVLDDSTGPSVIELSTVALALPVL
jgi:hypothetical protein